MGEPYSIILVAKDLIRLYGFRPDLDIQIEVIGKRKGEKMEEKLFKDNEEQIIGENPYFFEVIGPKPPASLVFRLTEELISTVEKDPNLDPWQVKKLLSEAIEAVELLEKN
jgi:FlaA1/EpsC-like NDP-sugar epimerase